MIPEEKHEQGQEYDLKSEEDRMLGWKREQKLREKTSKMHNLDRINERGSGGIAEERRKMGGKEGNGREGEAQVGEKMWEKQKGKILLSENEKKYDF